MGAISRALGQGAEFTFKDRTYVLSPWTRAVQGKFERYLEKEALATVRRMQGLLSPEEFKLQLNAVLQDITLGKYTFGTQAVSEALTSLPHVKKLLLLMLEPNQPDITMDVVEAMCEAKLEEMMEAMTLANADPNAKSPESTTPSTGPSAT